MRLGIFITLLFLILYVLGPGYVDSLGPTPDVNQYECEPGRPNDPDRAVYPSTSPVVKILRLTDSGELVDRCEYTDTLYELVKVDQEKIIILYIHGWKHNAEDDDKDRQEFTNLIERITDRENNSVSPRHVVGIYVSWNAAWDAGVFENITFWDRKRAADRISQSAVVTKLIGAIDNIRRESGNNRDRLYMIGHSFGGRILYSATSQLLVYNVQKAYPKNTYGQYDIVSSPADSIFILNPALEASAYTALDSLRRYKEQFSSQQQPLLVSISTENDRATSFAFPVGQWIGLAREQAEMTTLGNYENYQTHKLQASPSTSDASNITGEIWYDNFCVDLICLSRTEDRQERNPFLIVKTESDILNGHNGIWKPEFVEWLIRYHEELDANLELAE